MISEEALTFGNSIDNEAEDLEMTEEDREAYDAELMDLAYGRIDAHTAAEQERESQVAERDAYYHYVGYWPADDPDAVSPRFSDFDDEPW